MADSEFDMISHFGALDELIQLIYQGANKFVLLSAVDSVHWTVHLGLTGAEGRWWQGKWSEKDIFKFLGNSNASSKLVEAFADRLSDNIVKGELFIGNWSAGKDVEITLTLNPSARSPVHIPLTEMDASSAASFSCKMFAEIASQAQKTRNCRLYPSESQFATPEPLSYQPTMKALPKASNAKAGPSKSNKPAIAASKESRHEPTAAESKADEKIKELQAELAKAQQEVRDVKRKATSMDVNGPDSLLASRAKTAAPAAKPIKGASLANPNKKARRFHAVEFED